MINASPTREAALRPGNTSSILQLKWRSVNLMCLRYSIFVDNTISKPILRQLRPDPELGGATSFARTPTPTYLSIGSIWSR